MNLHKTDTFGITELSAVTLLTIALVFILNVLSFLFIPLCIAVLISYALGIPLEYLKKKHVPNSIRICLTLAIIVGSFYLIGQLIQHNLIELKENIPEFEEKFWQYANLILVKADVTKTEVREAFNSFISNIGRDEVKPVGSIIQWLSSSFFSFFGSLFWVLLFVTFLLAEKNTLGRKIVFAFGPDKAITILDTMEKINRSIQHYLGLKTLVSLATGIMVAVVLSLFGTPFPFLWGVLAFMLNFIPNIGSIIAGIPPIMLTLFDTGSIPLTLGVTVSFSAIQLLVGNIIEPKVMGDGLDLSPLVVLLSLLLWGWLWGVPGMLLSVPLAAALKISLAQIDDTKGIAVMLGSGDNLKNEQSA